MKTACSHCHTPVGGECRWFLGAESLMRDAAGKPPCAEGFLDGAAWRRRVLTFAALVVLFPLTAIAIYLLR
jgi:hypothetical protein